MSMGNYIADGYGLLEVGILGRKHSKYVRPGSDLYKRTYFGPNGERRIVFVDKALDFLDVKGENSELTDELNRFLTYDRENPKKTQFNVKMIKVEQLDGLKHASEKEVREVIGGIGREFPQSLSYKKPPHFPALVNIPADDFTDIGLGAQRRNLGGNMPGHVWIAYNGNDFPFRARTPSEGIFSDFYRGAQTFAQNYLDRDNPERELDVSIEHIGDLVLIRTDFKTGARSRSPLA